MTLSRSVLVVGGAGYVGGHLVAALRAHGADVVVVDDLSTGVAGRVPGPLVELDVADSRHIDRLAATMREHQVGSVVHLAGKKNAPESLTRPAYYARSNGGALAVVLEAMEQAQVDALVFSSSAAVYGETAADDLDESAPTAPANPYGWTKLDGERLVAHASAAWGLRATSLRYFNVAGAASAALADTVSHNLVTRLVARIAAGGRPEIFGDDYPTPDGTCVRDFVHPADLAEAHVAALRVLDTGVACPPVLNVGTGSGCSVRQMTHAVLEAAGSTLSPVVRDRRPGDVARVVARGDRARDALGWAATRTVADIASSAWAAVVG
jgi:UDP-glucose 4-epimerase